MARFIVAHTAHSINHSLVVDTDTFFPPLLIGRGLAPELAARLNLDPRGYEQKIASLTEQLAARDAELAKLKGAAVGVRTAEFDGYKYRQVQGGKLEYLSHNTETWCKAANADDMDGLLKFNRARETTPKPARYVLTVEEPMNAMVHTDGGKMVHVTAVPLECQHDLKMRQGRGDVWQECTKCDSSFSAND